MVLVSLWSESKLSALDLHANGRLMAFPGAGTGGFSREDSSGMTRPAGHQRQIKFPRNVPHHRIINHPCRPGWQRKLKFQCLRFEH
ncbi:MAG: hypothetical protein D6814_03880 [Calditrichaeota bacterium]|nr:MAG: hypothetical protein D6814_03880 [Calditrichota bacterium]